MSTKAGEVHADELASDSQCRLLSANFELLEFRFVVDSGYRATIRYMRMTGNWQPIWLQIPVRSSLNFRLLRELQSILDLNAKVPNSAFQFAVP